MKIVIILLSLLAMQIIAKAQDIYQNFEITGHIEGLKEGTHLYLTHGKGGTDTVATTTQLNNYFVFKGTVPLEAEFYYIKVDTTVSRKAIVLLLENSDIKIAGNISSWPQLGITGSASHNDYMRLLALSSPLFRNINSLSARINELNKEAEKLKGESETNDKNILKVTIDSLVQNGKNQVTTYNSILSGFVTSNATSFYTPHLLLSMMHTLHLDSLKLLYQSLADVAKSSFYGIELGNKIKGLEKSKNVEIGKVAPDFISKTPEGEELSLTQVISKGKYTLIDFWASWCKPCRADNPKLKQVYEKYNNAGLNILSVSLDNSRNAWKKAIAEDEMPWFHVSDLDRNGVAATIYNIESIPTSFLLDSSGKIIAKNLRANRLAERIGILLGSQ